MTLLSVTPDSFWDSSPAIAAPAPRAVRRTPFATQGLAVLLALAVLTVPEAVAQARWSKLNLIVSFVQHRYLASYGV